MKDDGNDKLTLAKSLNFGYLNNEERSTTTNNICNIKIIIIIIIIMINICQTALLQYYGITRSFVSYTRTL